MSFYLEQMCSDEHSPRIKIEITKARFPIGRKSTPCLEKFAGISRVHAIIHQSENGSLLIQDNDSLNGVFVNGGRIGQKLRMLKLNDVIGLGVSSLETENAGFLCKLCSHAAREVQIKHEVIDISDDDSPPLCPLKKEPSSPAKFDFAKEINSTNQANPLCFNSDLSELESSGFQQPIKVEPYSNCLPPENIQATPTPPENSKSHVKKIPDVEAYKKLIIPLEKIDQLWPNPPKNAAFDRGDSIMLHYNGSTSNYVSNNSRRPSIEIDLPFPGVRPIHNSRSTVKDFRAKSVVEMKLKDVKKDPPDARSSGSLVERSGTSLNESSISMSVVPPCEQSKVSSAEVINSEYSQCEEVIMISDDDSYLDFTSSQDVCVKKEPIDDFDDGDDFKNIFGRESETPSNGKQNSTHGQSQVESLEEIRAFVQSTEKICPVESFNETRSYETKSNFLYLDENISKRGTRKTLYTEPRPLSYRPRKFRGRDEGFVEKEGKSKDSRKRSKSVHVGKAMPESRDTHPLKSYKIPRLSQTERSARASGCGSTSKTSDTPRKKAPVKTRSEKFGSRMAFLTNEEVIAPKRKSIQEGKAPAKRARNESLDAELPSQQNEANCGKDGGSSQIPLSRNRERTEDANRSSSHSYRNLNSNGLRNSRVEGKSQDATRTSEVRPADKPSISNPRDPRLTGQVSSQNKSISEADSSVQYSARLRTFDESANQKRPHEVSNAVRAITSGSNSVSTNDPRLRRASCSSSVIEANRNPRYSVSANGMLKTLLKLKPTWLKEQRKINYPPPDVSRGAAELPLEFNSYDSYASALFPLALLEFWEILYVESKPIFETNSAAQKFYFSVSTYDSKGDVIELDCMSAVNEKVSYSPREGVFVILHLKATSGRVTPCFGYITSHRIHEPDAKARSTPAWAKIPKEWSSGAKHWRFCTWIKKKEISLDLNGLMKGFGICYMRSKLRLMDALRDLPSCPLLNDILKPRIKTFFVDYKESSPSRYYTHSQRRAINGICGDVLSLPDEERIFLVQGPPGTGKTHTIIGIIERLLLRCSKKILVCAASNAAIDEIGCRLVELNRRFAFRDKPVRFVRVGLENQVNPKILPYFLDKMAEERYRSTHREELEKRGKRMASIEADIKKVQGLNDPSQMDRLKYLMDTLASLRRQHSARMDYKTLVPHKAAILREAHVVLSTLNSCGHNVLANAFAKGDLRFSCCVVDEATQCTELDVLQPLVFKIRKLVLVGDHRQLPATVNSRQACSFHFDRSMFERFHRYFSGTPHQSPVFLLNEQFRMHSEICAFPSAHFYDNKLYTAPGTDIAYAQFPMRPYAFLDLLVSQEVDANASKVNALEAGIIAGICSYLLDSIDRKLSIGIITPYQAQKKLFTKALYQNPVYKTIEINTVDSFQGREKDVVILSSVRANGQSGSIGFLASHRRLNVSITRARRCLFICGHSLSLLKDPDWKALIDDAKKRQLYFCVTTPQDVPHVFKTYLRKR